MVLTHGIIWPVKRNLGLGTLLGLFVILVAVGLGLFLVRPLTARNDIYSGLIGAILGSLITIVFIFVAWHQLDSIKETSAADFLHKLKIDFFTEDTRILIHLLDSDYLEFLRLEGEEAYFRVKVEKIEKSGLPNEIRELLTKRKNYSVWEIDDYVLNHLEDLGYLYKQGLLTREMIYDQFSYFVEAAFDNTEIGKYIEWQRSLPRGQDIFSDAETIYESVKSVEPGKTSGKRTKT